MSSIVRIDLTIPSNEATFLAKTLPINTDGHRSFVNLSSYFAAIAGAVYSGKAHEVTGAVQATATMTSTGIATDSETASVANVTLTAKTSGADYTAGEFDISATVADQAANIAKAINMTSDFAGIVTATSALGVTTITAVAPGTAGNGLQISESLTNVTATAFSGGVDGHTYDFNVGQA
jgi:phage tail sheath gpL-like